MSTKVIIVAAAILAAAFAPALLAQDLESRMKAIEEQNRLLMEQNKKLTDSQNEVIRRLNATEERNRTLEAQIAERERFEDDRLQTMIREVGKMVEGGNVAPAPDGDGRGYGGIPRYGLTRGGGQLQFYGRVRLDAFFNSARFNRSIDAQWVRPEDGINAEDDDDSFTLSARLTTLGTRWDLGEVAGGRARAKIEFDFAGFGKESESVAGVRLLVAYFDIDYGDLSFRFGQDWDVISPYDPLVDDFRHLWDTGNLGDRRPLLQVAYQHGGRTGFGFEARLAVGATGTVLEGGSNDEDDGFGAFLSTEVDGFDSGLPHVQGSLSASIDSWVAGERLTIGVSGLYGRLETDFDFAGENQFTVWMVGVDFFIPLLDGVHLKGEGFWGSALGDFRGNIGQSINQTTGEEIEGIGGWAELYWQVTDAFGIGVGASIDNPDLADLDVAQRASNWVAYVATRLDLGDGFRMGLDGMFWKTEYVDREGGDAFRFNYFIEMSF
ncbi:MAG: hypothetical protein R3F20_12835 [Planctomycetota bacterium]